MPRKYSPHYYTTSSLNVETRQNGSMVSCYLCQILTLPSEYRSRNRDTSDWATFFQSSIVQFWWACANLSWQERHPVWSSAAVSASGFDVLYVQRCILHTLVITSGYCYLSIISNQSAHSPLTSDINKAFLSNQLPLTWYFLFFRPFSVNPRDGCAWQSQ